MSETDHWNKHAAATFLPTASITAHATNFNNSLNRYIQVRMWNTI